MSAQHRMKRRMVRDLVRENEQLLRGEWVAPRTATSFRFGVPKRILGWAILALLLTVGLSAAIVGRAPLGEDLEASRGPAVGRSVSAMGTGSLPSLTEVSSNEGPESFGVALHRTWQQVHRPIALEALPLAVKRVVVDPGHGGENTGTKTPDGLQEKFLTLDIGERLAQLLRQRGFEVLMTREDDQFVSLVERAEFANEANADIFVSIHVNWIEGRQSRGVETYTLGPTDDPYLNRLAAAENAESGYSLSDLEDILRRLYLDAREHHSRGLAEQVQTSLFSSLKPYAPDLANRGVKTAPFVVLATTEIPAVLAEVASLSDPQEAENLAKPLYRQHIAEALANGIQTFAQTTGTPQAQKPVETKVAAKTSTKTVS